MLSAAEMADLPIIEAPVLIIGSSMVGMTLSALLAKHGIRNCITVEKHLSTAIHPRAALFHPRTMQIYRELGLYEKMYSESTKHYDDKAGVYAAESLAGKPLGVYLKNINQWIENISPTSRLWLTQQMFEPLLRSHATENGAMLKFSTELIDFEQDDMGVTALLEDLETGKNYIVKCKYMVACDGNRSSVRQKLGIEMNGHGLLSRSLTIYFKADLGKFVEGKYNGVIYITNEDVRGFFRLDKTGREGFLVVNTVGKAGSEESTRPSADATEEKVGRMFRDAVGADVDFEVTLLSPWEAVCDVADRFNQGRVLLAGDAAHVVTPTGGFGGNTGIHDAHNLAWKLALVLQGKAGEELVTKTYNDERHPVASKTVNQVFARYITRTAPELRTEDSQVEEEVPDPHLELGYRYHSRALMTDSLDSITTDPATAKATPGSMAHHTLICTADQAQDVRYPIANVIGSSFVLLVGHEASAWIEETHAALSSDSGLPDIAIHQLTANNDKFYEKYDITPRGCVLIRPDGFVAWREGVAGQGLALRDVMYRILCLPAGAEQEGA